MAGVAVLATLTPDPQLEGRGRRGFNRVFAGEPQRTALLADQAQRWLIGTVAPERRGGPAPPAAVASTAVAFHGRLHNSAALRARLAARQRPQKETKESADGEGPLLATLFDEFGPSILREVRGNFHAVIVNPSEGRVHLVNDRLGSYPLYWATDSRGLVAAPTVSGVLAHLSTAPAIDLRAVADYVHFGMIFRNRTLSRGIEVVPSGSVVSWSFATGEIRTTRYWKLEEAFTPWAGDRTEYLQAVREAFNTAVERSADADAEIGMALSGGLDSRAILSGLMACGRVPVTYTLGVPGCADQAIAAKLAHLAGTKHRFVELDERYLGVFLPNLERMVELTDGMYLSHGLTEILALGALEQLGLGVLFRGHCGELAKTNLAWPFHTDARIHAMTSQDQFVTYLAGRANYVSRGVASAELFADDALEVNGGAIDSLRQTVQDTALDAAQLCTYVYIDVHQRRFTVPSLELFRTRVPVALPFADTEFLDVLLRGPAEWRHGTDVHRHIIGCNDRRLLAVRNSNTGAPGNAGPVLEAVMDKVNTVLKRLNVPGYRHYHRLDQWMHQQLLAAVQAVLLDPATLGRGIFRERTVRRLVEETARGSADHAHLLEVMLHVEIWQRQNT